MIALLRRFFDDIHRLAIDANRILRVEVTLCQEDRDLLRNFRRNKPRANKEDRNGTNV